MAISSSDIKGISCVGSFKSVLTKVNAGGSLATDISAELVSLPAKQALIAVRAGTATRAGINALPLDLAEKSALLAAAGV